MTPIELAPAALRGIGVVAAACVLAVAACAPAPAVHQATAQATAPPTPPATAPPTPTPSPNPLTAGMCSSTQLVAAITHWQGNTGTPAATVTVTNVSPATCEMRGKPQAQIVEAGGGIVADEGDGTASAYASDAALPLMPQAAAQTTVAWANWCTARGPAQSVTVALVLPLGLGRVLARDLGPAPVPDCQIWAGSPPWVTSNAWRATGPVR